MLLYSLLVTLHWDADGYRQLTVVVVPVKTRTQIQSSVGRPDLRELVMG